MKEKGLYVMIGMVVSAIGVLTYAVGKVNEKSNVNKELMEKRVGFTEKDLED